MTRHKAEDIAALVATGLFRALDETDAGPLLRELLHEVIPHGLEMLIAEILTDRFGADEVVVGWDDE